VTGVAYYDAQAYAAWAGLRLPTEAQWVRAATSKALASGDGDEPKAADAQPLPAEEDYRVLAPAASRKSDATPLGITDMNGNVAEWTRTTYAQPGAEEPSEPPYFGSLLVVRGGSMLNMPAYPLTTRSYMRFEERRPDVGFRCVLELPRDLAAVDTLLSR